MEIHSKRIILRNWKDEDIGDLIEGLNNINVSKWLAAAPYPYTKKIQKNLLNIINRKVGNIMKKKTIIFIIIVILLILLIPIPMHLNDGGTVEYKSILYKISNVHRLTGNLEKEYEDGTIIEILGFEVFNNVK